MSDPSTVLYQMGEAVAAKVSLGKSELLNGTNTWTGASNTFNNGVSIGDLTALRAATFNDNVTISGNLTVNGTTTALSTTEMEVKDNFIHLSKGASDGAYAKDSGFYFERGSGSDPQALIWDESEDRFTVGSIAGGGSTKSVSLAVNAQIGSSGSFTAGEYIVTFKLKGQLVSDITDFQISGTDGGSPVTDYNGDTTPFAYNSGTLSYIADSASPYTTFQQLAIDASKLSYSSANSATNGGYYLANTTDGALLEVTFDANPGSNDYIGLAHGSSVVKNVPTAFDNTSPNDDTANVTPGSLRVGSVTITDQTDGEVALGDLTDFEAGLAS